MDYIQFNFPIWSGQVVDGSCRIKSDQAVSCSCKSYQSILLRHVDTYPSTCTQLLIWQTFFSVPIRKYDTTYFVLTWNGQKHTLHCLSGKSQPLIYSAEILIILVSHRKSGPLHWGHHSESDKQKVPSIDERHKHATSWKISPRKFRDLTWGF